MMDEPLPERQSQATVYEIAARAGVSIATVSRVVNGTASIRPATRARVLEAIEDLAYVPNASAQGMARRSTGVIGLVYRRRPLSNVQEEGDEEVDAHAELLERTEHSLVFYDELIRGIEVAAYRQDQMVLLRGAFSDAETPAVLSMTGKCDGLVFMDRVIPDIDMPRITRRLPVASIAHFVDTPGVTNVLIDNRTAMRQLLDHMVDRHKVRRIAFIGGPVDNGDAAKRATALAEHAAERGVELAPLDDWRGDFTPSTAFDIVKARCADRINVPDVIMGVNDGSAVGAMVALTSLGLKVPTDVAVTGFDDMELARLTTPSLTTVRQPLGEMARIAVEALAENDPGAARAGDVRMVSADLIVRRSCGCPQRHSLKSAGKVQH